MKPTQMREIFGQLTSYYKREPDEAEYAVWENVLAFYEPREVKRQITIWMADDSKIQVGSGARTRGSFMPKASEIKAMLESVRREEKESQPIPDAARKYTVVWTCPVCGTGLAGFLRVSDDDRRQCQTPYGPKGSKYCLPRGQICGGILEIVVDERPGRAA